MEEKDRCIVCRRMETSGKIGRIGGQAYCQQCYLQKLERKTEEWKTAYRRFRNKIEGSLSRTEILEAPKFSEYIN